MLVDEPRDLVLLRHVIFLSRCSMCGGREGDSGIVCLKEGVLYSMMMSFSN